MIALYVLGAYMRVRVPRNIEGSLLSVSLYPNEVREVSAIEELLPAFRPERIDLDARALASIQSVRAVLGALRDVHGVRRFFRIIGRLERRHHFVTVCRTGAVIGFYARYLRELAHRRPACVIVTSVASPEAVALVAAARRRALRTLFSAHATLPPGMGLIPQTDIALLDGPASLEGNTLPHYCRPIFRGIRGETRPMRLLPLESGRIRLGIFLTSPLDQEGLQRTIESALKVLPIGEILIRPHPTLMLSPDLSELATRYPEVSVPSGLTLAESIARCDLVIASNSNVHLEVVRAGVPSVYVRELDFLDDDYCGFVARGIVPRVSPEKLSLREIREFFGDGWIARFRQFDPAYLEDPEKVREALRGSLAQLIGTV